jgi:nucleoside-diphosphate-sugar epimerase
VTDNAIMNSYLLRTAFEHKVKHLLFLSSSMMYHSSETPLNEAAFDANKPIQAPYTGIGNTKLYIEKMCEFYANISDTKFTSIRLADVYGPHDKFDPERSHFVAAAITKVMTAKDKVLIWGTGEEKRDLLYIDDLINFIEAVIEKQPEKYRLYNCGSGIATATTALFNKIIQHAGKELSVENDLSQATIKSSLSLDCTLAQNELVWKAQIDLDAGLRKTINWYRENVRIKVAEPA